MAETAKVFWSARLQAVRLPNGFRFDTDTVRLSRHSQAVTLEPDPEDWEWLKDVIGPVDEDFERAATEQPPQQDRPELHDFK